MALRVFGGFSRAIYDLQKQFHCAMRVKFRAVYTGWILCRETGSEVLYRK